MPQRNLKLDLFALLLLALVVFLTVALATYDPADPPSTLIFPAKAAVAESMMYTVQSGDSLSKIAKAHYGDAMKYMVIFEANTPMLKDPNKIYPGQVLRIPTLDR